ncbi:hypothetical protein HWV62_28946 [Athelia sp. TMB]|nr:hypothetical protein HWV62_28946 [Athelia sp. TMB]
MPSTGRHPVAIGSSLGRALKARKGAPAAKRATLPDKDYYSFRYNFKPESIDAGQPGSITVKQGSDDAPSSVSVERSGTQEGERHVFTGTEQTANMECVCVLIYDEETGAFTLEKLDSLVVLAYDKKIASGSRRPSSSPLAPPPSRAPLVEDLDLEAQLERDLMDEDAEGELEDALPVPTKHEEEEDEPLPPPRDPTPPPRPKPRPAKPKMKLKPKGKPAVEAAPAKKRRASPPHEGLALPGTFAAPAPLAPAPAPPAPASASDSEDDWVPALPTTAPSPLPPSPLPLSRDIFMEEEDAEGVDEEMEMEEIDPDEFAAEMNEHLDIDEDLEEEDFLAAAVEEEPSTGPPMSLNQFAGGMGEVDEDDYSSSEESDDD